MKYIKLLLAQYLTTMILIKYVNSNSSQFNAWMEITSWVKLYCLLQLLT